MNNDLQTDEFNQKKSIKNKVIIILSIIVILASLTYLTIWISNRLTKNKEKEKQRTENIALNEELVNTKSFAIDSASNIVAIQKNKKIVKIYNLLQGTETLGEFQKYIYFDNKLYLIYSDNSIYTISLTEGNKTYQLEKLTTYEPAKCEYESFANDIALHKDFIYFNNANCGVSLYYNGSKKTKNKLTTIKNFKTAGLNIEYDPLTKSLYIYSLSEQKIYKFDEKTQETTVLLDNINTNKFIEIKDGALIYSKQNQDNTYDYYLYNLKNNANTIIAKGVLNLTKYNNGFLYQTKNTIEYLTRDKKETIYEAKYDTLNNFELIGKDTLQIIDSKEKQEKSVILNIDLNDKNKIVVVNEKFSNIQFIEEIK